MTSGKSISKTLLCLFFIFSYLDRQLPISDVNFQVSDIILLLSYLFAAISSGKVYINPRKSFVVPVILLSVSILLSISLMLANGRPVFVEKSISALFQLSFIFLLLFPLIDYHVNSRRDISLYLTINLTMIAFCGLISITDFLDLTHISSENYYRSVSPFLGVNGFWMASLLVPFAYYNIFQRNKSVLSGHSIIYMILFFLSMAGIFLSIVRGAMVVTVFSLLWIFISSLREGGGSIAKAKFFSIALATVCIALVLSAVLIEEDYLGLFSGRIEIEEITKGHESRIDVNNLALEIADGNSYVYGIGLGQTALLYDSEPIHNIILQSLAELGALGLLAIIYIFYVAFSRDNDRLFITGKIGYFSSSVRFIPVGVFIAMQFYPIGYARLDWSIFLIGACWSKGLTDEEDSLEAVSWVH